jgi:hypothetical protein
LIGGLKEGVKDNWADTDKGDMAFPLKEGGDVGNTIPPLSNVAPSDDAQPC